MRGKAERKRERVERYEKRDREKKIQCKRDVERSERTRQRERKPWPSVTTTSSSCIGNTNQTLRGTERVWRRGHSN